MADITQLFHSRDLLEAPEYKYSWCFLLSMPPHVYSYNIQFSEVTPAE
jgi:hypothetical protein